MGVKAEMVALHKVQKYHKFMKVKIPPLMKTLLSFEKSFGKKGKAVSTVRSLFHSNFEHSKVKLINGSCFI